MPPQRPTTSATTTDPTVRELALRLLNELAASLAAHGLRTCVEPDHWTVVATNEALADTDPNSRPDPLALAYASVLGPVKLTQRVTLALSNQRELWWHWQWSGPTRCAPPEYQPLCPAAAIAEATERVQRVLALAGQ